jgi:hypothetical protein
MAIPREYDIHRVHLDSIRECLKEDGTSRNYDETARLTAALAAILGCRGWSVQEGPYESFLIECEERIIGCGDTEAEALQCAIVMAAFFSQKTLPEHY